MIRFYVNIRKYINTINIPQEYNLQKLSISK